MSDVAQANVPGNCVQGKAGLEWWLMTRAAKESDKHE